MYYFILLCLVSVLALHNAAASTPTFKVGMARDMFLKYATSDELQYNGTKWWADWVNSQGGIKYGGISRQVEVVTLDASTPDPNQTATMVKTVYEKLINDYQVDIVIGAAATARTAASTAVTEKYGVINFVVGSLTDSLFASTKSMIYTSATPNALVPSLTVDTLIKAGAKNYVIFIRTDAYSMTQGQLCDSYLKSKGITQSGLVYINNTATDTAGLQVSLANNINLYLINKSVDIFIYSSISNEFVTMMTTFDGLKPVGVKSAVFLVGNSREALRLNGLGTIGDYWLVTTRFDPSFGLGTSGQYGGTTEEFSDSFIKMHGVIPSGFDALAPAILMSYYRAVSICDTTNSTIVSATLKNMTQFDTFAFPLKYQNNGTNMFPQLKLLQYINGVGRLVTQENLVYPMVWNKNVAYVKVAGKSNNKKVIAIAVPIGVVILAIAIGASIYIRKKHKHAVKVLTETEEGERRNYMVDYSALTLGNMIGAGGFGYVFKGEYRGAAVAVKKLKVQMEKAQLQEFAKESAVMIGLRHPNILLFMGVCLVPPELCIITEFMCRGSVYDIIHNEDVTLSFNLIHSIVLDVLKGLQFIHSAGIVHRDLKSPNLLVDKKWNIKIADFGLSAVKAQADDTAQVSLLWTAPEILSKQAGCYSEKSDVFSLGIIIWELLSRKTPYENLLPPAIAPAVISGQRPTVDNSWNQHMVSLMNKCWAQNPQARCTVKEAREIVEGIYVGPEFNEVDASFQGSLNMSMIHTQNGSTKMKTDEKAAAPTGSVTFVSTAIAHANELWEHDPHGMVRALALHNELIRKTSRQEKGYEVKNSYDMFLFAFQDHIHAINFCLRMQTELMALEWSESILKHPYASEKKNTNGALLFKGLNIKLGMHIITTATQKVNEQTGQVDYYGPEVAIAPRLASFAEPGLILVSPEMYAKVMVTTMSRLEPFVIESCSTRVLTRGKDPVQLYKMTTRSLRERSETDDVEVTDNGDDLSESSGFYEFPVAQDLWNIKYEDLKFGPKIGAGSFGEVRSGTWNGESVAIKQVIRQKTTDTLMLDLRAESIVLRKLDHRNVLKFRGMCFQQPNLCLVTELLERGSLSTILYNPNATLTWDQKLTIIRDVVNGMMYLHSKSLIHRDVKSSNLLVSTDWTVKIADFGFSRIKADNQTMTQCGTVAWTAPEIFEGAHYSEKADVYSFAIILWELIFRRKPWDNLHSMKIVSSVLAGQRPSLAKMPANTPDNIVQLMEACWNQDPNARPNFDSMSSYLN